MAQSKEYLITLSDLSWKVQKDIAKQFNMDIEDLLYHNPVIGSITPDDVKD